MTFIHKKGEVFSSDPETGMELFNQYKSEDLPQPDEVEINSDPLTGEVSIIQFEETGDLSVESRGQRPPDFGTTPSFEEDEEMKSYRERMSKSFETDRDRELQKGAFLKERELYRALEKGWDTNEQIQSICTRVRTLMKVYGAQPDGEEETFDRDFLDKASQVLLEFDPTLPNTYFSKCIVKHFSKSELAEMVQAGQITEKEMNDSLEWDKGVAEAKAEAEAKGPIFGDKVIGIHSMRRWPETREGLKSCEECEETEDGKFLQCHNCRLKSPIKTKGDEQI